MAADLPDLTQAAAYGVWTTDRIRFCDTDQAGHVNNVAYAAYAETGRLHFMNSCVRSVLESAPEAGGDGGAGAGGDGGHRFIAASITVNYLRETHFPGAVDVGAGLLRLGRTSFTLAQGIFKDDLCVATALGTIVYLTDKTPTPLTPPMREAMSAYLIA